MEHLTAQLRIRRLYRNIDRRKLHLDYTLYIPVAHIGQRNIISLQERQSGIIILKIQGFPHSRRHLVYNTLVAAGAVFTHQAVLKFNPKIILILLLDLKKPFLSVTFPN